MSFTVKEHAPKDVKQTCCEACGSKDFSKYRRWEYLQGEIDRFFCEGCWKRLEKDPMVRAPWSRSDWIEPRGSDEPQNLTDREKNNIYAKYRYQHTSN